jgi:uncharacterized protein YunC (DUF1805 family)
MNHAFQIIPLTIEAKGEIIQNNLPEFRELVREALGNINRDLVTDEQFGQAELDVKALKEAEDAVRTAAVKAFDDQLKALVDGLNETAEEIRVPRLELEKIIAKRKEDVKSEIAEEFLAAFDIDPKDARKHFFARLKGEMSGKRTVESMRKACRIYQTTQQAMIAQSRASIERFVGRFGADLVMDRREMELKSVEVVEAELIRRIEAKKAAEEAVKLKAEAEAAKAEAAKAQTALAEANKPPVPPANPSRPQPQPDNVEQGPPQPSGVESLAPAEETADQEWAAFKTKCLGAFKPLKEAREVLKHSSNIAKATIFSNAINKLWREEMQ